MNEYGWALWVEGPSKEVSRRFVLRGVRVAYAPRPATALPKGTFITPTGPEGVKFDDTEKLSLTIILDSEKHRDDITALLEIEEEFLDHLWTHREKLWVHKSAPKTKDALRELYKGSIITPAQLDADGKEVAPPRIYTYLPGWMQYAEDFTFASWRADGKTKWRVNSCNYKALGPDYPLPLTNVPTTIKIKTPDGDATEFVPRFVDPSSTFENPGEIMEDDEGLPFLRRVTPADITKDSEADIEFDLVGINCGQKSAIKTKTNVTCISFSREPPPAAAPALDKKALAAAAMSVLGKRATY